jgi:REP element-mobilizing transposase RayT
MKYITEIHKRRSIRLPGYDYAQNGAYFLTLCTKNREPLFGEIVANGVSPDSVCSRMLQNEFGDIVASEWLKSASIRSEIALGEFVIMPNHFHGIILIRGRGDRPVAPTEKQPGPRSKSVGALIAGFKSVVTRRINIIRQTPRVPVWQRNYYDHIIKDVNELRKIQAYIQNNPRNWLNDEDNPVNYH